MKSGSRNESLPGARFLAGLLCAILLAAVGIGFVGCGGAAESGSADAESEAVPEFLLWTVMFADGDKVIAEEQVRASEKGASVTCPKAESEGMFLAGWEVASPESEAVVKETAQGGSYIVTVYADGVVVSPVWEEGATVSFEDGEGAVLDTVLVRKGDPLPAIANPVRSGFVFEGWDQQPETVESDMTIVAKWREIPSFSVVFTDGDGNVLKEEVVYEGEDATPPSDPAKDGYTFNGWEGDYRSVTENRTVNATWKVKPTVGMENALRSAKSYLSLMPFSYAGLIKQLEYEQYTYEEAVYAVDNCGADWNEQAAKSAESYLDLIAFSRNGLIDQLMYEGFTYEQAVYGVDAVGL